MDDFNLELVARKSVKSIFALVSRTFFIQVLGVFASFILTIYLSPSDFGVFFIVSSFVVFLNYFSDIGLAASLIQKKEEPNLQELRNTFTIQQILVLLLIIPCFALSGQIASFFKIDGHGIYLLYAFLISFLLSSLKTIPTVILERKLDFHRLVIPQIAENLVYNLTLILMAVGGYGITSFTVAIVLRSIVGLIIIYFISPWKIGFAYDRKILKGLLSFGIPFQVNSLLALVKDDLINVYIGKVLPLTQVGYIGFAQKWAFLPLRLVMDNVIKIMFPSLSRLQHDRNALRVVIEKSLFVISFFIMPTAVGFIMLSPYFIDLIPSYHKWAPAYISIVFFALNTVVGSLSTPITNFLYATGKAKLTLYFMAGWTTLSWILTPLFIIKMGYNGVAIASFLVAVSTLSIYFVARKYITFSFIRPILKPLFTSLLMMLFIFITQRFITSLPILLVEMLLAGGLYFTVILSLTRKDIRRIIVFVRNN
ncbi:MAG: oligosaccharide flippase family protein [Patescibacteria group bacterium]